LTTSVAMNNEANPTPYQAAGTYQPPVSQPLVLQSQGLKCSVLNCNSPGVRDCRTGNGDDPNVHCGKPYCSAHVTYVEYHTAYTRNSTYVCDACRDQTEKRNAALIAVSMAKAELERQTQAARAAKAACGHKCYRVYWATTASKVATVVIGLFLFIGVIMLAATPDNCSSTRCVGVNQVDGTLATACGPQDTSVSGCYSNDNSICYGGYSCVCPFNGGTICAYRQYGPAMTAGAIIMPIAFVAMVVQACITSCQATCCGCVEY